MRKSKAIIQHDFKDCGVTCMQWIIIYYGGYISLEKLREDTLTDSNGTNAYQIVTAFKKWGFDAKGILVHDLTKDVKFPLIAHMELDNGLEHFVVVKECLNDTVYLMDPGIGNIKMTLTKFNKLFTGHIILVYPRDNIVKMDKGITISKLFLNIISKEKFLIIKIILTSLVWTILSIISSYYLKAGSNLLDYNLYLLKCFVVSFGIITLLKVLSLYIREYFENHLSNLVDTYIYPEFLRHLFYLPSKVIKSRSTGEIVTRISELSNIKSLFSDIFISCFLDSLMAIISIVILFMINHSLCYILIICIVIYTIYSIIISKIIYKKVLENINYQTEFNSLTIENISMFDSIKNLNITDNILIKLEKSLSKYLFDNYHFNSFFNLSNLGKDFLLEMCLFIINSYGFYNILNGNLTIIDLFTFNLILAYFIDPIKNIISILPKYNYVKASFTKISEFINLDEEEIKEDNNLLKGDICFRNVSYSYNNYNNVIDNLSFNIKSGEHTLLNGISGSGKSTICKLLYKENYNYQGEILIDNCNIKDLSLGSIRDSILYVSQNEELFTGSIKDNILMGRDVPDNLFQDVANICELESIVSKKSMRYDSLVEVSAKNISGGEKQRIILARGLLKNANIIILDEALSEVDKDLESKIIKNIKKYFHDKTIIYISHKNQTRNFSHIINLGEQNELLSS